MPTRSLILAAGLLVVVCGAGAQTPTGPAQVPSSPPSVVPRAEVVRGPYIAIPVAEPVATPAEKSLEQILRELEVVQAQKADILKKEADLKVAAQKKLADLQKHLDRLGAGPGAAKVGEPARVGRILIDGFAKKDQEKVLQAVGMQPGQILRYPELEAARQRIEKLGFKEAEVI